MRQPKARREAFTDDIARLRTYIDRTEREAVGQFNEHMDTVLEMLGYENLECIWFDRRRETVSEGRWTVEQFVFDLHVVRSDSDGTSYEDSIAPGYLTHDMYESCPSLLLDSIEAIDSNRIDHLVDYVAVALLPEDVQALDGEYERITNT